MFSEKNTPQSTSSAMGQNSYGSSQSSNSERIQSNEIFGQNNIPQLKVVIDKKPIPHFKHFTLLQSAMGHHSFTLVLDFNSLESKQTHKMEDVKNMLGKRLTATFTYRADEQENPRRSFVGVITNVSFSRERDNQGNVILTGKSPTILLDGAPHLRSFGGKQVISLKSVAQEVIEEAFESHFDFRVEPVYSNVSYVCQYEETAYNFLARIAETYGEQFYYDGTQLHFGKLPIPETPIKLVFGKNVDEINIELKALHVNRSFYGYNSGDNQVLKTGKTPITHQSSLAKTAYESSMEIFKTPSLQVAPMKAATGHDIESVQKSTIGSLAVDVFVTSGKTSVPFLYPGCVVDMEMYDTESKETNYLTKLMVIEVNHSVDFAGNYVGHFEAIASDTGFLPRPVFHNPIAEPQTATVVDNKDDKGRVQVRFDWQDDSTEWIRVMTPDAGGSDKVSKNRGFVAIPEIGDQVMVGFIHNHPDRPYVMGSLFHGKVGSGGGSGNNVKSLSSKSGHTIELNDAGGITIRDKSGGDMIVLDGTNKITVTSTQTIELNNGKSAIKLDKNKITIHADEIEISKTEGDASKVEIKGLETLISGKNNVTVKSEGKMLLDSQGAMDVKSTGTLTASGSTAKLESKGITEVKGATVNIN
ncbi:type VI secretion system Vgr family protein [Capnocytophaga canimorsus]